MPEEEVSSGPAITIEPKPMGLAETPSVVPPEASTDRGGLFKKILSKLPFSKGRSPEPPPAASAQTPMPTEMPSASPPQTEAPQPLTPPTPGTPTI